MADAKLTALTAIGTVSAADILYIVDDPAGSPLSRKVTVQSLVTAIIGSSTMTGATVTASTPVTNWTQTWNNAGVQFTGLKCDITDSASANGSRQIDFQVGGLSTISVIKDSIAGGWAFEVVSVGGGEDWRLYHTGGVSNKWTMRPSNTVRDLWWDSSGIFILGTSSDVGIGRSAASILEVNSGVAGTLADLKSRALITPKASTLTIATGVVTITGSYHTIDTEAAAATDDLDTINGGADGKHLVIRAQDSARTVVAKDGTGNLKLAGDHSMDNLEDTLTLISDGTNWYELCRSNNGA
jgi:hypothetical protein